MFIQKLRLQRGWSQQQLADMSGLSSRTIQRIESGQPASMESLKSLAAVFEVDFATLQGNCTMSTQTISQTMPHHETPTIGINQEEKDALQYVRKLKRFYYSIAMYIVVVAILAVVNFVANPDYLWVGWVALGWGVGLCIKALKTFDPFLGPRWERHQVEKRLGRKL